MNGSVLLHPRGKCSYLGDADVCVTDVVLDPAG
jgi:hypothetical protein